MASRAEIEQAKGILMAQSGVSADEAFRVLSRASQRENRKLRDIARDIVERSASDPPDRRPATSAGGLPSDDRG